jgi:hypothetical protein
MAFPAETVTSTLVAASHLIFTVNGSAVGRITDVTDIATGKALLEHKGHNADGTAQTAYVFELEAGSGKYRVTCDEIIDADASTYNGLKTNIVIKQVYQKDTAKVWAATCAKAYIQVVSVKPNIGSPSTVTLEVIPYNDPGTAAWTFDNQAAS